MSLHIFKKNSQAFCLDINWQELSEKDKEQKIYKFYKCVPCLIRKINVILTRQGLMLGLTGVEGKITDDVVQVHGHQAGNSCNTHSFKETGA